MILKESRDYLVKARIDLSEFFGEEAWVELKETDTFDAVKLERAVRAGDAGENVRAFSEIFPRVIVDHNFFKAEAVPMTPEEVRDVLVSKPSMFSHVVQEYVDKILFIQGKKKGAK
jgi:hypothetical protein